MQTLFVVATPIGNLEDITLRAIRVLKEADLIVCEDTRHTKKLLNHLEIKRPTLAYHQHNEQSQAKKILDKLKQGSKIALVTDAGTPCINDPGRVLVEAVINEGGKVEPIPGPSAFTAALSASGLKTDSFLFLGFLPKKAKERKILLLNAVKVNHTLIFYEAPHRLLKTLQELAPLFGNRRGCLVRELTKIHEEFLPGTLNEWLIKLKSRDSIKGEFVILLEGKSVESVSIEEAVEEAKNLIRLQSFSTKEAAKTMAEKYNLQSKKIYNRLIR